MENHDLKPVFGYETHYVITNAGQVFSIRTYAGKPRMRPLVPVKLNGYSYVLLSVSALKKMKRVHRLVWEAFNGPIPNGLQINHLNGVKTDNRLKNLELCTPQQNSIHSTRVLKKNIGERSGLSKLSNRDVLEIVDRYKKGERQVDLAARFGVAQCHISRITRGASRSILI